MSEKDKDPKAALDALEHVGAQDTTSAETWFHLGVLKYEQVDREGAIAAFERVLEIDPNDKRSADLLKMAKEHLKQEASQGANKERTDGGRRRLLHGRLLVSIGIILLLFGVIFAVAYPLLYEDLINRYNSCAWFVCSQMSELRQQIELWNKFFWPIWISVIGVAWILGTYCCVRGHREESPDADPLVFC
jgi:tetratricopeptide (TPR) repeat protein